MQPEFAGTDPTRQVLTIPLTRGDFTFLRFPSKKPAVKAIILFGSGDGGWRDDFEEKVARGLQEQGFDVISFDCADYSQTDYDLPTLQADMTRIARAAEAPFRGCPPPLIVGGYSMGAEQAVAVAGGPNPPPGIAGLLLISPTSRGRYGLRTLDKMDIPPSGPGTFGLADFAERLGAMRVAQWHGDWDPTDSVAWLSQLSAPHQKLVYPSAWHDFQSACPDFLLKLGASAAWVASPPGVPLANTPAASSVPEKVAN
ncbi:MAG TPA: AcvB/VirJ family lysyl-phosphatidylglycerol hydrolase [Candidatus Methylacidiphilales bacterium]|nr:AcvB/VirJ family lysyl-phosphatidylglycerol hydrolase [Candidatus Methylacidiphilales bacterium]